MDGTHRRDEGVLDRGDASLIVDEGETRLMQPLRSDPGLYPVVNVAPSPRDDSDSSADKFYLTRDEEGVFGDAERRSDREDGGRAGIREERDQSTEKRRVSFSPELERYHSTLVSPPMPHLSLQSGTHGSRSSHRRL